MISNLPDLRGLRSILTMSQ